LENPSLSENKSTPIPKIGGFSSEYLPVNKSAIIQQELADTETLTDEELDAMLNANDRIVLHKNSNQENS